MTQWILPILTFCAMMPDQKKTYTFFGSKFVHRHSDGGLHEFTPKDQPNLDNWTEMLTLNRYATIKAGEDLAKVANNVLGAYQDHGGKVLKTSSIPRTEKRTAEHLIVVSFDRNKFSEVAFSRFLIDGGIGCSLVFSHRSYGGKSRAEVAAWIAKNGAKIEKELMAVKVMPKP